MQLIRRRLSLVDGILVLGFALGACQASFKELPDTKVFHDNSDQSLRITGALALTGRI